MFPAWLGDVASLATLIGLGLTFWQSYRARTAAELARKDVESFRSALFLHDLSTTCAAAVESLEAILQDHREKKWERLLERYGSVRRNLGALKGMGTVLPEPDRSLLQEMLLQFARIADRIETWRHNPIGAQEAAELAMQVARERDKLSAVLGRIRQQIGRESS